MSNKSQSNTSIIIAGISLIALVGAIGSIVILGKPSKEGKTNVAIVAPAASSPKSFDPVTAPAIDYTKFEDAAASSVAAASAPISASAPSKQITPVENAPFKEPVIDKTPKVVEEPPKAPVKPAQETVKKKIAEKKIAEKKVDASVAPSTAASAVAPSMVASSADKPKTSDFSYVQPVSKAASVPKQPLADSRNVILQKVQPFEPIVMETVGDRAWIKVSPTNTVIVEKGQELPGFGKLLSINGSEAVFEKSTLHPSSK